MADYPEQLVDKQQQQNSQRYHRCAFTEECYQCLNSQNEYSMFFKEPNTKHNLSQAWENISHHFLTTLLWRGNLEHMTAGKVYGNR